MAAKLNSMEQSLQKLLITAGQEIFGLLCNPRSIIKVCANALSHSFVMLWAEVIDAVKNCSVIFNSAVSSIWCA
jgi:hypothetical protein